MTFQHYEVASTAFLIAHPNDQMSQIRDRLEGLELMPHLIVRRETEDALVCHLFEPLRYLAIFAQVERGAILNHVLPLSLSQSVPVVDAYLEVINAPERYVVVDEEWIVGFVDRLHPPTAQRIPIQESDSPEVILDTSFPEGLEVGETGLLSMAVRSDEEDFGMQPLPPGGTLEMVAVPSEHFRAIGNLDGSLKVSGACFQSLQIEVRAIKPGRGRIRVLSFYRGICVAQTCLNSTVVLPREDSRVGHWYRQNRVPLIESTPDLSLWILERTAEGEGRIEFRLSAADPKLRLNMKPFGVVSLGSQVRDDLREFFELLEDLVTSQNAEWQLAALGADLFERLMPEALRAELWALRNRVRYVQIQSDEPWIPWELCHICGPGSSGQLEREGFLCERFALTRWRPGLGQKLDLSLQNLALILPKGTLDTYFDERSLVLSIRNEERQVTEIRPTLKFVERALRSGNYDCIHFGGHGSFEGNRRQVFFLDGGEYLMPWHISGEVTNLGKAEPLVFLNACDSGRTFRTFNALDGWAQSFLKAGCAAFVGSYWRIADDPACIAFTRSLYQSLLAGKAMGDAVREARRVSKAEGGLNWLAYSVYAHPLAALRRAPVNRREERR